MTVPTFPTATRIDRTQLNGAAVLPLSQNGGDNEALLSEFAPAIRPLVTPANVFYASQHGAVLDLDPSTRLAVGGGVPTDNAPALNAILATATALQPLELVIDGHCGIASALSVPNTGYVMIRGINSAIVLAALAGANSDLIHSAIVGDTAATYLDAWEAIPRPSGAEITIRDLTLDGNHNTYPNGNSAPYVDASLQVMVTGVSLTANVATLTFPAPPPYSLTPLPGFHMPIVVSGLAHTFLNGNWTVLDTPSSTTVRYAVTHADLPFATDAGILTLPASPDARGPYANLYWLTGINLHGITRLRIENVYLFDMPAFSIYLFDCPDVRVHNCTFFSPSRGVNTDGVHLGGGCSAVKVTGCTFIDLADDPIAFNVDEGSGAVGYDLVVANCQFLDTSSGIRVYGNLTENYRVLIHDCSGFVFTTFLYVGFGGAGPTAETSHSITVANCDVQIENTGGGSFVNVVSNVGTLTLINCQQNFPVSAYNHPFVYVDVPAGNVSTLNLIGCQIHRSDGFQGAAYAVLHQGGTIGTLTIDGFRINNQSGKTYAAIPKLVDVDGSLHDAHVNELVIGQNRLRDVTAFYTQENNGYVRRVSGVGVAQAGVPISDVQAMPGTWYQGADHAGSLAFKSATSLVTLVPSGTQAQILESVARDPLLWAVYHGVDLNDSSGFLHALTNSNGSTFTSGKFTNNFTFNGTNQCVFVDATLGTIPFATGATPFEICGWFKPSNVTGVHTLVAHNGPVHVPWQIYQNATDLHWYGNDGAFDVVKTAALALNVLIFISVRFTGTAAELDVNNSGTPATTAVASIPPDAAGPYIYFGQGATGSYWAGQQGHLVLMSGRVLTPTERTAIFTATAPPL